ncbi:MAG: ergothioneine biosynthesis protein EgtB [Candidatus Thiodiazotropha sp. (ex Myrtea sp. 'scaly one' KF741663)]|nr:ergothioneine biosynthesis protein EgtB [Candidatus Thiodiazotropha sp. (ex Myrtea sp. 'scaly one' KF741663)]
MSTLPSTETLDTSEAYDERLLSRYEAVRAVSELICEPLAIDDYQLQSIVETSPPKWHLAHVSWFFETLVLSHFRKDYRPYHPDFNYIFNSYYYTVGEMHPRPKRGMLSRPTVEEIYNYRRHVDEQMRRLMAWVDSEQWDDLAFRVTLGLNHEQQHQELLLMDIKHNLSVNPLLPAYRSDLTESPVLVSPVRWEERAGGVHEMGHAGDGFSFDNETPRHQVLMRDHRLANRLVTNQEYLEFIDDGGYQQPALWMADGWTLINQQGWRHPLYWRSVEGEWREYTLGGVRDLNPNQPVCHMSFYEADAYARWVGKRLPGEAELELMLDEQKTVDGNFFETGYLHPATALPEGQWYGDLWNWTNTSYAGYPGFKPLKGAMGEYNGKFMSNQMVLKGGCCVTPSDHIRASYRNFYYPHDRWPFTGIRLAEDL